MQVALSRVLLPLTVFTNTAMFILFLIITAVISASILRRPYLTHKFLHNKGVAFFVIVLTLFSLGSSSMANEIAIDGSAALIINLIISLVLFPLWLVGVACVIIYFFASFFKEEKES